jgi:hypothetical protein
MEIHGRPQVVAPQGDGWIRSFDALTGELIWKFDINPKHRKDNRLDFVGFFSSAPVFYHDRLYIALGNYLEHGELPGRLVCLDPSRVGDISPEIEDASGQTRPNPDSGVIWRFEGVKRMMGSVAIDQGLVVAADFAGILHCLDADTGRAYWTHDLSSQVWASPLIADDRIIVGDVDGKHTICALSKNKRLVANCQAGEAIASAPVFANGVLYVSAGDTLYAIEDRSPSWAQSRSPDRSNASRETGLERAAERDRLVQPTTNPVPARTRVNRAPDAVYLPTPQEIVEEMLKVAKIRSTDRVVDLGSGDGRFVITAAKLYGIHSVGYEIDARLVEQSRRAIKQEGLEPLARIEHEDLFTLDLQDADVVTVFLYPRLMERLIPQLEKLKPGARVVSHQFEMPGIKPDREWVIPCKEDGEQHRILLWTAPLRRD